MDEPRKIEITDDRFRHANEAHWVLLSNEAQELGVQISPLDVEVFNVGGLEALRGPKWADVLSRLVTRFQKAEDEMRVLEEARREVLERPLQVFIGGRGSGKTYRAAQWVKEHEAAGAVMVCHSAQQARILQNTYGLKPKQVLTPNEVRRERLHGRSAVVWVDDLDALLADIFGPHTRVAGVSVDGELNVLEHLGENAHGYST